MGEFWDEHDFQSLIQMDRMEFDISCTASIEPDLLSALKSKRLRHINVETLVNPWLYEKLAEQGQAITA
ncbi:MAG: hypothetical protein H6641_22975 [Caldilineaceae bacterium]|nr:hypothetical protein [Caldilineaceae bacterium]